MIYRFRLYTVTWDSDHPARRLPLIQRMALANVMEAARQWRAHLAI